MVYFSFFKISSGISTGKDILFQKLYVVPGIYAGSLTHRWAPQCVRPTNICRVHQILAHIGCLDSFTDCPQIDQ